jgi:hypothetical protein
MRSITCIGVVVAALSMGVAACGGTDEEPASASAGSPNSGDQEKMREAQLKFAQCMRANGVEKFPDPDANGGTRIAVGPDSGIDPEEFEAASKKCEQYRSDIRPQLSEAQQAEFKEKALEHARCMREHGIDFPDPEFSGGGKVTQRLEKGRVDPNDADFKAAEKECGSGLRPGGEKGMAAPESP